MKRPKGRCLEQKPGDEQRDAAQRSQGNHPLRAGRVGRRGGGGRAGAGGGTSGGVRAGSRGAGGAVETLGVTLEPSQSLQGALVGVDTTNTTLTTGVVVEEPKGLVGDIGGDRYRENGDRSSVNGVAETGVEPVDAAVGLVCSDTWRGERGLGHRVVALGEVEEDNITLDSSDELGLEDEGGVGGRVTADLNVDIGSRDNSGRGQRESSELGEGEHGFYD